MRYLYSLILFLILPLLFVRLWWRSRHNIDYRKRWTERVGFFPVPVKPGGIWIHAVSLGEAIAATPLIRALLLKYPELAITVTSTTPTGSAYLSQNFRDQIAHSYLPFDLSVFINRFLNKVKPRVGIILETELWPNLIAACRKNNVNLILANACLSVRSAKGYARIKFLITDMLNSFTRVLAQTDLDGRRFINLGLKPEKLLIAGNIKFDLDHAIDLKEKAKKLRAALGDRTILVAASTHEGEEEIILQALAKLVTQNPKLLLILVPRHADRFDRVAQLCAEHGFKMARRSKDELPEKDTAVYLCDTFGELMLFYAVSDFAFVGGSLIPVGGHNLIQPASLGVPVLSGPELQNVEQVSELLLAENALKIVHDANQFCEVIHDFIINRDEAQAMGMRAFAVVDANRGALTKNVAVVDYLIRSP